MKRLRNILLKMKYIGKVSKLESRKTPIILIDDNDSDTLRVLSNDGNWYTIGRNELIPAKKINS